MGNTIQPEFKGYHVLKVRNGSPAAQAGLRAYFDFIVAVNGQSLNNDSNLFPTIIRSSIDQQVVVSVYSGKTGSQRNVLLVPRVWALPEDGFLGCSIRYCDYSVALGCAWHVVQVSRGSPAFEAGLRQGDDYIIGSPSENWREVQDLFAKIGQCASNKASLQLLVYNCVERSVRETTVTPNANWGGEGLIGAELASGALHKVPIDADEDDVDAIGVLQDEPARSESHIAAAQRAMMENMGVDPDPKQPGISRKSPNVHEKTTTLFDAANVIARDQNSTGASTDASATATVSTSFHPIPVANDASDSTHADGSVAVPCADQGTNQRPGVHESDVVLVPLGSEETERISDQLPSGMTIEKPTATTTLDSDSGTQNIPVANNVQEKKGTLAQPGHHEPAPSSDNSHVATENMVSTQTWSAPQHNGVIRDEKALDELFQMSRDEREASAPFLDEDSAIPQPH